VFCKMILFFMKAGMNNDKIYLCIYMAESHTMLRFVLIFQCIGKSVLLK
jgi:hypothetical protein